MKTIFKVAAVAATLVAAGCGSVHVDGCIDCTVVHKHKYVTTVISSYQYRGGHHGKYQERALPDMPGGVEHKSVLHHPAKHPDTKKSQAKPGVYDQKSRMGLNKLIDATKDSI